MKFLLSRLLIGLTIVWAGQTSATDISGAGSSAAKPLYESWAKSYKSISKDNISYDPAGSTAGLVKARDRTVDFGATDIAIASSDPDNLALICVPTSITGVVPFINLPGVGPGQLILNGIVLAGIYAGKIKSWNDPAIVALNPRRSLPNIQINPVGRVEGSGTTYVFTDFLSKTSPEWRDNFGTNMIIAWPNGVVTAKGSSGVVAEVKKIVGSVGYVDYSYILENHLTHVSLQNHDKHVVEPTFIGFNAALTSSNWKTQATFEEMLTDRSGDNAWPITTATFILIPRVSTKPEKTIVALKFLSWALLHGDEIAKKVGYVRLTDPLQAKVFSILTSVKDQQGKPLNWSPF